MMKCLIALLSFNLILFAESEEKYYSEEYKKEVKEKRSLSSVKKNKKSSDNSMKALDVIDKRTPSKMLK